MAGLRFDDLFGADTLKKVASGDPLEPARDRNFKPAASDAAKRNQDYADKKLAHPKAKSPLASPMTPQSGAKQTPPAPAIKQPEFRGKIQNND